MAMQPTERVRKYKERKKLKGINVTEATLVKLKAYQQRWELPSLTVAIDHAVTFSKPE